MGLIDELEKFLPPGRGCEGSHVQHMTCRATEAGRLAILAGTQVERLIRATVIATVVVHVSVPFLFRG